MAEDRFEDPEQSEASLPLLKPCPHCHRFSCVCFENQQADDLNQREAPRETK